MSKDIRFPIILYNKRSKTLLYAFGFSTPSENNYDAVCICSKKNPELVGLKTDHWSSYAFKKFEGW